MRKTCWIWFYFDSVLSSSYCVIGLILPNIALIIDDHCMKGNEYYKNVIENLENTSSATNKYTYVLTNKVPFGLAYFEFMWAYLLP